MALVGDLQDTSVGDEGFRGPGVEPTRARAFVTKAAGAPA
jgi:hypothetical protein